MSVLFEVYYRPPRDMHREASLNSVISRFGGHLGFTEEATEQTGVVLSYEFPDWASAEKAAASLRQSGEHVDGPMEYAE